MKSIVTLLLFFVGQIIVAQEGPKIVFNAAENTIDYGTVYKNEDNGIRIFEFTNTGNAPLIISKVEPACNCTDAIWTKTPIMPGQKGEVQVTFDAATSGKFSKTAVVTSNAKPTEQTLVFTGTVVKK